MARRHRRSVSAGLTLLELLVVLAIAGLLVALVPPVVSAVVPGVKLKVAARELAVTLRDARNEAISRSTPVDVVFGMKPPRYAVGGRPARELPGGVRMAVADATAAASDDAFARAAETADEPYRLRFYPDGSSNGVIVRLENGDTRYRVDVGWLMGRVLVSEARDIVP